jgi:hypothetical protein
MMGCINDLYVQQLLQRHAALEQAWLAQQLPLGSPHFAAAAVQRDREVPTA